MCIRDRGYCAVPTMPVRLRSAFREFPPDWLASPVLPVSLSVDVYKRQVHILHKLLKTEQAKRKDYFSFSFRQHIYLLSIGISLVRLAI